MIGMDNYVQQLADYIKENLTKGYTMEALKVSLINQGYSKISVDRAVELANKQLAEKAPIMKEKPQITLRILDEKDKPIEVFKKKFRKSFLERMAEFFNP